MPGFAKSNLNARPVSRIKANTWNVYREIEIKIDDVGCESSGPKCFDEQHIF